jgi:hypothetical protein
MVAVGLMVLGLALAGIGIAYFTIPAKDLPGFLPGKPDCGGKLTEQRCDKFLENKGKGDKHLAKRGVALELVAVISIAGGVYVLRSKPSAAAAANDAGPAAT